MRDDDWTPGGGLLHPVPLVAIATLVINDHWLKAAYGTWWTGKLSDVAGMLFFPLLLQAAWEVITRRPPTRRALLSAAVATGLVFGLVQVWAPMTELYALGLGALQWPFRALRGMGFSRVQVTPDPSDLWTLPALAGAVAAGWRRARQKPARSK